MTRNGKPQTDRWKCPWCRNRCNEKSAWWIAADLQCDFKAAQQFAKYKCPACGGELLLPADGSTTWRKPEVSK